MPMLFPRPAQRREVLREGQCPSAGFEVASERRRRLSSSGRAREPKSKRPNRSESSDLLPRGPRAAPCPVKTGQTLGSGAEHEIGAYLRGFDPRPSTKIWSRPTTKHPISRVLAPSTRAPRSRHSRSGHKHTASLHFNSGARYSPSRWLAVLLRRRSCQHARYKSACFYSGC